MTPQPEVPASQVAQNCFDQMRLAIEEISDPEYQARVWRGDPPDEKSSYRDASSEILELGERYDLIARHLGEIGLNQQQWDRVMEFSRALQNFESSVPHPYDDAEVMRHPNWNFIVKQARALLAGLPKPD